MELSDIVSFVFRVLNFAAILGLIVYFFRTRFLDQMRSKIREKEVFWKNLKNNKTMLVKRQEALDDEINWQDTYGQKLLDKIDQWHKHMDMRHEVEIKKREEYSKNAERRRSTQEKYAQLQTVATSVATSAFERVGDELEKVFSNKKKADAYLGKIVTSLQKSR